MLHVSIQSSEQVDSLIELIGSCIQFWGKTFHEILWLM